MLLKIVIFLAVILVGVLVYAAILPSQMFVEREIQISASPDVIFPYINNSKKANDWMPWKDSDTQMTMTYSGPDDGVGSKSTWQSQGQMGTGEALVVESVHNQQVKTKLTYVKPFTMEQLAEISLTPVDSKATRVKWNVRGEKSYMFRLIGIFLNCDKMIGAEFEKGLNNLKTKIEAK